MNTAANFAPLIVLSLIYASLVYVTAKKRNINPWGWTIGTVIPFFGMFVAAIFFFVTLLSILDRLNTLEGPAKFD
jgi:hypothetical protein